MSAQFAHHIAAFDIMVLKNNCVGYRELFQQYVKSLSAIKAQAVSGQTESAKLFKREVDSILLQNALILPSLMQKGPEKPATAVPDGADAPSRLKASSFPLYLTAPLHSSLSLGPPTVNPHLRKDILVSPEIFVEKNIAAPYFNCVKRAVAKNKFAGIFKELNDINHLKFILPFSSLHETAAVARMPGRTMDTTSAQISVRALSMYLSATQEALALLPHHREAHLFWQRSPPLTYVSFTQECDIFISLIANRRNGLALVNSLPSLDVILGSTDERLIWLTRYFWFRNVLKEQKAKVTQAGVGYQPEGPVTPIAIGTKNQSVIKRAYQLGIPADSLSTFLSATSSEVLDSTRNIGKEVNHLAEKLLQRERNNAPQ